MLKRLFNLQLFADEGTADTGSVGADTGSVAPDAGGSTEGTSDSRVSFDELINGEYKEDYTKAISATLNKRMKKVNETSKRQQGIIDSLTPVMELMGKRYGVDTTDINNIDYNSLTQKIMDDNAFYEEEALARGMDVDAYKAMVKMERDNARLRREQHEAQVRNENERKYQTIMQQVEQAKAVYPSINFDAEMENPAFQRMVWNSGVPVKTAYEVIHKDEIMGSGMAYATQRTAQMISNNIQSGLKRPDEVGLSGQSSATANVDSPRNWDSKKRDEIRKRVLAGERVIL